MKAKVLIAFYDKEAKVNRTPKDPPFDVAPARFNEITAKGRYIEACDNPADKAIAEKK